MFTLVDLQHSEAERTSSSKKQEEEEEEALLILVVEIKRCATVCKGAEGRHLSTLLRCSVAGAVGVWIDRVVFVERGKIPRTPSGKTKRSACRMLYEAGKLEIVFEASEWETFADSNLQELQDEHARRQELEGMAKQRALFEKIIDILPRHEKQALQSLPVSTLHASTIQELGFDSVRALRLRNCLFDVSGKLFPFQQLNSLTMAEIMQIASRCNPKSIGTVPPKAMTMKINEYAANLAGMYQREQSKYGPPPHMTHDGPGDAAWILTGATGYLGSFVLGELLERHSPDSIFALFGQRLLMRRWFES